MRVGNSPGVLLVIGQNAPVRNVAGTLILNMADNRPEAWVNPHARPPGNQKVALQPQDSTPQQIQSHLSSELANSVAIA